MKNIPRMLIALSVFFSGVVLVLFVGLPQSGFTWQRYANVYHPPGMTINHASGQPGSFFTLTGVNFDPNASVAVSVNGQQLGNVTTDSSGGFVFRIDSTGGNPGKYIVFASGNLKGRSNFDLDPNQPLHPPEGQGVIFNLPTGIAFTNQVLMPVVRR